jgi:hypothetical protein
MSQTAKILNISEIKAKQEREDSGEPFHFEDGGTFTVAFIGREDFSRRLARLEDQARLARPELKKKDQRGNYIKKLPPEVAEEIGARAMFGSIVLGWSSITADGITPLEFTEENFVTVLKSVRGLGNAILEFSSERENYHREQVEANAGN